jgi:ABC-2 type transport system permease protein
VKIVSSLRRASAIAGKEWTQIRRDSRSLILSILAPALLIMLFGYALTVDVKNVRTVVFDQDRTAASRSLLEKFSHTEYLNIVAYVDNYRDIDRMIDRGETSLAIVIPRKFEKAFKSGKQTSVQVIIDGSDSTSATVSSGYVKAIVTGFNLDIKIDELKRAGISSFRAPVDIRNRVWYNPELRSKNFIIPGLIVIILAIISALIASLTISREWERGTMETLITTPVRPWEMVTGKIIPYLIIGLFDVILTACTGYFVFDVPIKGSFIEFYLLALLFLAGTSSLGLVISTVTKMQVLSVQIAMVATYLPSFILSGFIFPIENMPVFVQGITYLIPARYLIVLVKGIVLKGVAASLLWMQIVFLAIFASVVIFIGIRMLSTRLPEGGG